MSATLFTSQRFIDTRTGEIVIQIPVLDIRHYEKYAGSATVGEFVTVTQEHKS